MTRKRHCDQCSTWVPEDYLYTQAASWLSLEDRRPAGSEGNYTTDRLDFCGWECLASYAMSKALNSEVAG